MKEYYPKYGMREMSDHDILFDASRAEDVRTMMERLGFRAEHFGTGNHDCYYKKPVLNFEMHRALFGPDHDEKLYAYYKDTKNRLIGDGWEKHFSPEDFYPYMTAHEYKHYSVSGTGLRSLLDTYVYLKKEQLDMDYVTATRCVKTDGEKSGTRWAVSLSRSAKRTRHTRRMPAYIHSSMSISCFCRSFPSIGSFSL